MRIISLACASTMLFACGGMGGAPPFQQAAAPEPAAAAGADADGFYALGRAQHGALRYDAARAAYQRALQLDPAHLNARNGLAVLHAGRGEYAEAIALWRAMLPTTIGTANGNGNGNASATATASVGAGAGGPQAAFLWGNLGYAYFLSGADEPALAALEQACLLDPLNALSWEHLGELLRRMGQGERAALMHKQAASLRQHDHRRDYALLAAAGTSAEVATTSPLAGAGAVAAPWPRNGPQPLPQTEVRREGAALVSVHRVAPRSAPVSSSAPPSSTPPSSTPPSSAPLAPTAPPSDIVGGHRLVALSSEDLDPAATLASIALPMPVSALGVTPAPLRLEISNGNGVAGMAAALARIMSGGGLQVVRLSNVRHFAVPSSHIEYPQVQEGAARALAARLGLRAQAQTEARGGVDLRIVLGRDLRDPALLRQRYLK
ncbi:LytR C-terminal domain-containing protein [Rugamonas sp. CCM 8940]|uniref:LytR C-terminal domain-containing protein n=1 Tax=Rugamonas sp. CCM 8940 TaxID=2765359 RepID=UPI0018F6452D|nr:LytR C-terminal domain-containing protein [Rugamonas sp. CCM 8940]MBJ7309517.1 LytR C-terminal domain-containing protein [Rugamonas sp. CCM 8940]